LIVDLLANDGLSLFSLQESKKNNFGLLFKD